MNEARRFNLKGVIEAFNGAVDELRKARSKFSRTQKDLSKSLSLYGPVKIGDVVEVNGHSHIGKKMTVDRVVIRMGLGERAEIVAIGFVHKKDGTPGILQGGHRVHLGDLKDGT